MRRVSPTIVSGCRRCHTVSPMARPLAMSATASKRLAVGRRPRDELGWLAGQQHLLQLDAHQHHPQVALRMAHLQGQVDRIRRCLHARQRRQAGAQIVRQGRGFGLGTQRVLLDHPQIGAAAIEQGLRVIHHAAIHARHGQRDPQQQAEAESGEEEAAPCVRDIAAGEADHGSGSSRTSSVWPSRSGRGR